MDVLCDVDELTLGQTMGSHVLSVTSYPTTTNTTTTRYIGQLSGGI